MRGVKSCSYQVPSACQLARRPVPRQWMVAPRESLARPRSYQITASKYEYVVHPSIPLMTTVLMQDTRESLQ